MADSRDLLVRILGDDRSLQQAFTRTERRTRQFESGTAKVGRNLTRAFGAAGIALGTATVFEGMSVAIKAASDLEEQMARSSQVFEENAASVQAWSKDLASSFGIAQAQGLEFAGTFGLLFRNLGVSTNQAEDFSRQLVELAADLASFNNTDVDTALNALRSGLTGEVEPLRRFGVFLSEARSNMEALGRTGKKSADDLTTQEKVLARLNIILQDTSRAQGDFARTSDGLANKQRIAAAEAQNLAANVGKVLAPAMDVALTATIGLTGGINDLIAGMDDLRTALRNSDFFDGFNAAIEDANSRAVGFFQTLRDNIPLLDEASRLRGAFVGGGTSFSIPDRPEEGTAAIDAATAAAEQQQKDAAKAKQELARARSEFDAFVKGLGLKLDRAGLTTDLNDDLTVMREIERAIQRRINAEGRTFELVQKLTDIQLLISSTLSRQQADAEAKKEAAIDKQLEQQRKAREEKRRRLEQQAARREQNQFEALGLTSTGDPRVPGAAALRRRLGNVRQQVEGTVLDTEETERQLDRIAQVLSGKFGKVGKDVRAAILGMLNDISGALKQGDKDLGPLTKTTSINSRKLLAGLGLSPEEIRELRGRLSNFNSSGVGLAGPAQNRPTGGFTGGTGIVVENNVTVAIDGQKFSAVVTKQQQKAKRRNPKQKRGPNRNR